MLTLQALAEFFHAVTRKNKMPAEKLAMSMTGWSFSVASPMPHLDRSHPPERSEALPSGMPCWSRRPGIGGYPSFSEDMQDGRMVGALRLENPFKEGFDLGLD